MTTLGMDSLPPLPVWLAMPDFSRAAVGDNLPNAVGSLVILYGMLFLSGLIVIGQLFRIYNARAEYRHRAVNRFLWRPWTWMDACHLALLITACLLAGWTLASLLDRAGWVDLESQPFTLVMIQSISFHWVAILAVVWLMHRRGLTWTSGFAHRKWTWLGGLGGGLIAYVALIPFLFSYAILYHVWLQAGGETAQMQEAIQVYTGLTVDWQRFYFIFLAVVLAPVSEEILFRGILLPALGRIWGVGAAIAVSSVLFALMHMHVPSLVPLLVLSVGLSLAYIYSKSLLVPISMHMIFNAISLLAVTVLTG